MLQAPASVKYHNAVNDNPGPSRTDMIREAIKEFVEAVAESSRQLAVATEQFAREASSTIADATRAVQESAATSAEMADAAKLAAEEARGAADTARSAVAESAERVRTEAQASAELVAGQGTEIQELGERIRQELTQNVDVLLQRLKAGSGEAETALSGAQAVSAEAREAASRVEASIGVVEAAVAGAQRAAEEAREAAARAETTSSVVGIAVRTAQEAAQASLESAMQATQAGAIQTGFGGEANVLLERLETDYSLLTRLVQELHGRITALDTLQVAEPLVPVAAESGADNTEGAAESAIVAVADEAPAAAVEAAYPGETMEDTLPVETGVPVSEDRLPGEAIEEAYGIPAHEPAETAPWPAYNAGNQGPSSDEIEPSETPALAEWVATPPEPAYYHEAPVFEPPWGSSGYSGDESSLDVPQVEAEAEASGIPSADTGDETAREAYEGPESAQVPASGLPQRETVLSGRVQLSLSPVPDFDRLLNLDGALARIDSVQSVTLADYAQEVVFFRLEMAEAISSDEFARRLGEAAGISTEVTETSEDGIRVRIH